MTSDQLQRAIIAIDENELKHWMTDLSPAPMYEGYRNIDHIHLQLNRMWVHGAPHWVGSSVWTAAHEGGDHTNYDTPPPWNPTLQDVEDLITEETELDPFYGSPLDGYYHDWVAGTLVKILQYRGRFNVDIYSPLLGEHINYINSLCNEFERDGLTEVTDTDDVEDDDAFDLDSEEEEAIRHGLAIEPGPMTPSRQENILDANHILVRNPPYNASVSTNETTHNLCIEGVNILDRIMETDTRELNEGDYLKLMNLFRDLHT